MPTTGSKAKQETTEPTETAADTTAATATSAFNDALASWNERVKATQQQVQDYQRVALENLAKVQETFAQELAKFTQSDRFADRGAYWEQVSQNVDQAFDFAVELLNRQRAYTKSVVEAAAGNTPDSK